MSLDRKVPGPGGRLYYVEPWDPVQRQQKDIAVTLFGQTRLVPVGDFALPRWYGLVNVDPGDLRMTWLDQELKAFEPATGGYQIADESDGRSVFLCQGEADVNGSRHSRSRRIVERRAR